MDALRHVRLMAEYNRWMNQRILVAAAALPADALRLDRGPVCGSILDTLNRQAIADATWLRRFEQPGLWARLRDALDWLPRPPGPGIALAADLDALHALRDRLDALIVAWGDELIFKDLDRVVAYENSAGETRSRQMGALLSHFFNQQTHHRGQATALLCQAGADPGATDLIAMPGFDPFSPVAEPAVDAPDPATPAP
jgi:uncharacterized damage-inducible protein DinB